MPLSLCRFNEFTGNLVFVAAEARANCWDAPMQISRLLHILTGKLFYNLQVASRIEKVLRANDDSVISTLLSQNSRSPCPTCLICGNCGWSSMPADNSIRALFAGARVAATAANDPGSGSWKTFSAIPSRLAHNTGCTTSSCKASMGFPPPTMTLQTTMPAAIFSLRPGRLDHKVSYSTSGCRAYIIQCPQCAVPHHPIQPCSRSKKRSGT